MSRIGKLPIPIPEKVTVTIEENLLKVKGPLGQLQQDYKPEVSFEIVGKELICKKTSETREAAKFWGLYRTLANNMVEGVSQGFTKELEVIGVGYKVELTDPQTLTLNVGYSHPVVFKLPDGISAVVEPKSNKIELKGHDKYMVGQLAANIRKVRPPEPYKGKGIKYKDETIRRKEGKAGGA